MKIKTSELIGSKETKQYCVTVKLYTWAEDKQEAVDNVIADLDYICKSDSYTTGFIHPELFNVEEDKEI